MTHPIHALVAALTGLLIGVHSPPGAHDPAGEPAGPQAPQEAQPPVMLEIHERLPGGELVIGSVLVSRVAISAEAPGTPVRFVAATAVVLHEGRPRSRVYAIPARPVDRSEPVQVDWSAGSAARTLTIAPAPGRTWGQVAGRDDLVVQFVSR